MNFRKLFLNCWIKTLNNGTGSTTLQQGFTLAEILVAALIGSLIIAPLLGAALQIIQTQRDEEVKANSQQEIQAALQFIARDLQQAVYIYDRDGLAALTASYQTTTCSTPPPAPPATPNCSQLPADVNRVPVLVFWKRQEIENAIALNGGGCPNPEAASETCDDTFVYSLVAYYLVIDDDETWSNTSRIERFQIRDGVRNPVTGDYIDENGDDPDDDIAGLARDRGYLPFGSGGTLDQRFFNWQRSFAENYELNETRRVLVDFIDQSTSTSLPLEACPEPAFTAVPNYAFIPASFQTASFYACVNRAATIARVFLRGNSLARINDDPTPSHSAQFDPFFPRGRVEVRGEGSIN
ncbi:MAG: prepilin-type N-terminal cleavage/methylation domain-containing protein [Chloroflexaceae bacterium]|nr:prepilin-type N-terminal cleavage/methylation domain-containing protein [Chloroflexaceae bacterium]